MQEEHYTIAETQKHILQVMQYLEAVKIDLARRQYTHDRSKLEEPELHTFIAETKNLKGLTYGSKDYFDSINKMKEEGCLAHHYAKNRHHAEHFKNGIEDMTLVDIIEMLCDWMAAVHRHADGDIYKSLEINQERFNINPQLIKIMKNTVDSFYNPLENLKYQDTL